jgi:acyl phosphate:glycerol-3-phosphate acyltransferase
MIAVLALLAGYIIGGFPTGILLSKWLKGVDPRKIGSHSSGATNVSRVLGKKWAVVVLIIDGLKGFLPVRFLTPLFSNHVSPDLIAVALSIGLIMGHIWTPYAGFRGGKGVATAAGAMIALSPIGMAIAMGVWIVVFLFSHIVSVSSVIAAVCFPLIILFMPDSSHTITFGAALIALIILYTHRENLQRLKCGEEKKMF